MYSVLDSEAAVKAVDSLTDQPYISLGLPAVRNTTEYNGVTDRCQDMGIEGDEVADHLAGARSECSLVHGISDRVANWHYRNSVGRN
jgi:hypothetical protein